MDSTKGRGYESRCLAAGLVAALPVLAGDIDRTIADYRTPAEIRRVRTRPARTVPVPAGSYVIHYGSKIHYDGAKGEECVIQVWGMGPATSTPAEKKQGLSLFPGN